MARTPPVVVIDTETYLIQPSRQAPKVVSVAVRHIDGERRLYTPADPTVASILRKAAEGDFVIAGHNLAYDMACLARTVPSLLPEIFNVYKRFGAVDTILNRKLWLLKRGKLSEDDNGRNRKFESFSLDAMAQDILGYPPMDKGEDGWRLRYGTLDGVPFAKWPQRATDYALGDVQAPFELLEALEWTDYPDLGRQTSYAFALYLTSSWGLRTDPRAVAGFREHWEDVYAKALKDVKVLGIIRENGTKDTKKIQQVVRAAWESTGIEPEHWEFSDAGKKFVAEDGDPREATLSAARDTLIELAEKSNTPELKALKDLNHAGKALNTFAKLFEMGVALPIHPRIDTLKATGRVSMSKPNLQQLPREEGFREVFVPRRGNVFLATDIDTAEVRAYGQTMLDLYGFSNIAEGYQRNPHWDPHTHPMGAAIEGKGRTYEDAMAAKKTPEFKPYRNMAKGANFGLPGGMGAQRLIDYVRGYGVTIDKEKAWEIKNLYERVFPESTRHGQDISKRLELGGGEVLVETFRSKRARLCNASNAYCQARNYAFQPVVADIAKLAALYVTRAQYVEGVDPRLYGTRPVNMVHDELIIEASKDPSIYREAAVAVEEKIKEAAKVWCPDVPFEAGTTAMARLQKGDPVHNESGELEVLP